jgi:hypothetical protein
MSLRRHNEVESVRHARHRIALIRRRLLKPTIEALDACMPHLNDAVHSVQGLQRQLEARAEPPRGARETLRAELAELRLDLSQVTALMRSAAGFYGGLSRLLSRQEDDLTGYNLNGAVSSQARPVLQLEG